MPGARKRRQSKTSQRVARMRVALIALAAWAAAGRAQDDAERRAYVVADAVTVVVHGEGVTAS